MSDLDQWAQALNDAVNPGMAGTTPEARGIWHVRAEKLLASDVLREALASAWDAGHHAGDAHPWSVKNPYLTETTQPGVWMDPYPWTTGPFGTGKRFAQQSPVGSWIYSPRTREQYEEEQRR